MKQSNTKIGVMVFAIMSVSFALIFLFVQLFLSYYMEESAVWTLKNYAQTLQSGSAEDYSSDSDLFQVMELDLDNKMPREREPWEHYGYHGDRQRLIQWCEENGDGLSVITKAKIGERNYYLYSVSGENGESILLYVDFSAANEMLWITKIVMLSLMVICTLTATLLGFRMGRKLRKAQDEQRVFFENASHELKTPLMSIQGFTEGLQMGVVTEPEHAYEVIMRESQKMSRMVDEILYLSKHDRGMASLNLEEISIEELIGDCLDALEPEIRKKDLSVQTDIHDRFLKADEEQMRRAVSNLISNALRYARSEIRITFSNNRLVIWDDGDALSEEDLEKVFERFHTGKNGNTGIGLALAREVIESHGFTLHAKNENGGVSFIISMNQQQKSHKKGG